MGIVIAASAAMLGVAGTAVADHFHSYNQTSHGLVHGSSTTDASFFARVETLGINTNYCIVGDTSFPGTWYNGGYYTTTLGSTTCSQWSQAYYVGSWNECRGVANVAKDGFVSTHNHFAHNYSGPSCKVYNA
jgi:hypothetical protein